jgi:DNA-binding transcriptional regulator YiaG
MHTYTRKKTTTQPSKHTQALLKAPAVWEGSSVSFEVEKPITEEGLTSEEVKALRNAHNTPTPNFARARDVKNLLQKGYTRVQTFGILRHKGYGYGERQVFQDYATLSAVSQKQKSTCKTSFARGNK